MKRITGKTGEPATPFKPLPRRDGSTGTPPKGVLWVVATPIGNLGDLSPRAVAVLKQADLILAEDTRTFRAIAESFGISTRPLSYYEHNEQRRTREAVAKLESGLNIALISEAGTPTISDPGYRLVKASAEAEIQVIPVPGPCSPIAALCVSGFETDRFAFLGFVPQKPGQRRAALQAALEMGMTVIFLESPHRILKTLDALVTLDPQRDVFLARELTKYHEEMLRGPAEEVAIRLRDSGTPRGELVLVIRRQKKKSS